MTVRSSILATVIATFAIAGSAHAATVTTGFDGISGGNNVNLGGDFEADDLRIVGGNCNLLPGGSGAPCAALNRGDTTTISRTSGLGFFLTSFWYQLLGASAELEVSYFDSAGDLLGSDFFSGPVDGENDGGHVVMPSYTGEIFSVLFDNPGENPGNVRIDDLAFEVADAAVPLPAAGILLLSGFGGLAFLRRRKDKASTTA